MKKNTELIKENIYKYHCDVKHDSVLILVFVVELREVTVVFSKVKNDKQVLKCHAMNHQ